MVFLFNANFETFQKEENMRKGIVLSMVAALSIGVLAGCSGALIRTLRGTSKDVKV